MTSYETHLAIRQERYDATAAATDDTEGTTDCGCDCHQGGDDL